MTFTTDSYEAAKVILEQLHDSNYRCMIDNVSISFSDGYRGSWLGIYEDNIEGDVSVDATIVFFEYQKNAPAPAATPQTGEE